MARVACVDIPALPLQLLLRDHPDWRERPVVVVRDDRPQGEILWANLIARRHRVLSGMTYAAGRSLASDLRAAVVAPHEIEDVAGELFNVLCGFSPRVEPGREKPGVFWLDPNGLESLYGTLESWSEAVISSLIARGFDASLVVGFHRHRVHAIARTSRRWLVVADQAREKALADRVPLDRLDLSPVLRDGLAVLGIHTLGQMLRLPQSELRHRFGEEAARLHAMVAEPCRIALAPTKLDDPMRFELQIEPADSDRARLIFAFKGALHPMLTRLASRGLALSALRLELQLDHAPSHHERLEPAAPTLNALTIVDLVRLRLESLALAAAVEGMVIEVEAGRADAGQLALFESRQKRDLAAANRAIARVRAVLGPMAVTRARLRSAHLPEASFSWEPIQSVTYPGHRLDGDTPPPLVRRVFARPLPLPSPPSNTPEEWLADDPRFGAVDRLHGPYRVSGGWWIRTVERDYYYAETRRGNLLWLFYDRPRRRWFLHGVVD